MSVSQTLDAHMGWLSDQPRIDAFRAALRATVAPGQRVLDIGTGTGVLAILACEAGAAHVYAIDEGPIIGLAREIARAHGLADRITFLRGHSSRITLPEPVDLAVADLIGHFAFEAGIFDAMTDARARHLAPGGRTIPESVTLHLAPIESVELRERVAFWSRRPADIDMSPAHRLASHAAYQMVVRRAELLDASRIINHFELAAPVNAAIGGAVSFVASRGGALDGVAGWFTACLSPGVFISNAPDDPRRLDRCNLALPLPEPVQVHEGDAISVTLRVLASERVFTWTVDVARDGQRIAFHKGSTFRSILLSAEDLDHAGSASRPMLNDEGEAQRLVLRMADGRHTVAEIEMALREGFTGLFPTTARAAEFITEALTRFAR